VPSHDDPDFLVALCSGNFSLATIEGLEGDEGVLEPRLWQVLHSGDGYLLLGCVWLDGKSGGEMAASFLSAGAAKFFVWPILLVGHL
jgi:hypothetical protein